MGVGVSHVWQIERSEFLPHFVDVAHIPPADSFWTHFLGFHLQPPTQSEEQLSLESVTETYLQKLLLNNPTSGNISSLLHVFITRATHLLASPNSDNAVLSWQTLNALFAIRCIAKFLVETVNEQTLCQHFHTFHESQTPLLTPSDKQNGNVSSPSDGSGSSPIASEVLVDIQGDNNQQTDNSKNQNVEQQQLKEDTLVSPAVEQTVVTPTNQDGPIEVLIDAIFGLIIDVPVTDNTYHLHLEAINTLQILLSVHMFAPSHGEPFAMETSHIFRTVFGSRYSMHASLLIRALLKDIATLRPPPPPPPSGSFVLGFASSIWSIVSGSAFKEMPEEELHKITHPMASQACLLVLTLTNHLQSQNLYRDALITLQDINEVYSSLTKSVQLEHVTLLLYILLHRNRSFRSYLLSRADLHNLVVPLIRTLYDAPKSNSHHIYMSLIILLILSEDDNFNKSVHETTLKNVTWYTERNLTEVSLGGMLILVIIRTVQFNMLRTKDKYLHTNCLAALANMSSEFRNLHPYVAQRFVSLFETLSRKHTRLAARIHLPVPPVTPTTPSEESPNEVHVDIDAAEEALTEEMREELLQDMVAVEEVLRMVLEIINSCLSAQLRSNVHLVYSLLHKRALFHRYRTHAAFQDLIQNIEMIIGYFSARLQRAQEQKGALGANEVLAVVSRAAENWSTDRLRKFPELKFRYVEEEQPEEFFTPYVWSLVCSQGSIRWSPDVVTNILTDLPC